MTGPEIVTDILVVLLAVRAIAEEVGLRASRREADEERAERRRAFHELEQRLLRLEGAEEVERRALRLRPPLPRGLSPVPTPPVGEPVRGLTLVGKRPSGEGEPR